MKEVFNADIARQLVKDSKIENLSDILEYIKDEATRGNTRAYWYGECTIGTQIELQNLGFKISFRSDRNESFYYIEW